MTEILFKTYLVGVVLLIVWWSLLAYLAFADYKAKKEDSSLKSSVDSLLQTIESTFNEIAPNLSLQAGYCILTLIVTFFWPIFLIIFIKNKVIRK